MENNKNKKNLNPLSFVFSAIFVFAIFLIVILIFNVSGWLYTYNTLTDEKIIGEILISKKILKDGIPSGNVKVILYDQENLLPFSKGEKEKNSLSLDFNGDMIFIDAYFIRWENWLVMLGFKPVYKIYRIKSDFRDIEKANTYKRDIIDLSSSNDNYIFENINENYFLKFFIQGAFISSVGQSLTNSEQKFNILVTKDGIVLERK